MRPSAETSSCFPIHGFDEELELRYAGLVRVAGLLASIDDSKEGIEEENEGVCVVAIVVGITVVNEEVGIRSNSTRLRGAHYAGRCSLFVG